MSSWIGIVVSALLIGIIQGNYLRRVAKLQDLIAASLILTAGLGLYLLLLFEAPIPTLTKLIDEMMEPLYMPIAKWLMKGSGNG
ncbi:hypothetical protein GRF59_06330 [Paenibacillus sp. HJL G12]|uniref:Uncharacterized protein n=1 Tax=Paenibacillus dendrobii TaxID=2691084 RepID=A0A7X3IG09_9BACL|nr:hypothetical protein [Paenibacillus dendrobii]MWV43244.1 hypothetical protein [Paenibacillus dendrobii]